MTVSCDRENNFKDPEWSESKAAESFSCESLPLAEHDIFFEDLMVQGPQLGLLKARARNGDTHLYLVDLFSEVSKSDLLDLSPEKNTIYLEKFFHNPTKKNLVATLSYDSKIKIYDESIHKVLSEYKDKTAEFTKLIIASAQNFILAFYSETQAQLLSIGVDFKLIKISDIVLQPNYQLLNIENKMHVITEQKRQLFLKQIDKFAHSEIASQNAPIESFGAVNLGKNLFLGLVLEESLAAKSHLLIMKKNKLLTQKYLLQNELAHISEPYLWMHDNFIYLSVVKWLDQEAVLAVFKMDENLTVKKTKVIQLNNVKHLVSAAINNENRLQVMLRSKAETGWKYDLCTTDFF